MCLKDEEQLPLVRYELENINNSRIYIYTHIYSYCKRKKDSFGEISLRECVPMLITPVFLFPTMSVLVIKIAIEFEQKNVRDEDREPGSEVNK